MNKNKKLINSGILIIGMIAITTGYANTQYVQAKKNLHFYMAAQAGLVANGFSASGDLKAYVPTPSVAVSTHTNGTSNSLGIGGDAIAGIMWDVNQDMSLGAEINWGANSSAGTSSHTERSGNTETTYRVTQKMKYHYGISMLIGSHLFFKNDDDHLLYMRLGWVNGLFNSSADDGKGVYAGYDGTFNKWDSGMQVGVGLTSKITDHWDWRVEADYIEYGRFTKHSLPTSYFPVAGNNQDAKWTYKPRQMMVSVGVIYKF